MQCVGLPCTYVLHIRVRTLHEEAVTAAAGSWLPQAPLGGFSSTSNTQGRMLTHCHALGEALGALFTRQDDWGRKQAHSAGQDTLADGLGSAGQPSLGVLRLAQAENVVELRLQLSDFLESQGDTHHRFCKTSR